MFKNPLLAAALLLSSLSFAATDVNKATAADLDAVKGIGPAMSGKILEERKKGVFKDWRDFIARVSGVGVGNAAKFSAEGLTIDGATFKGAATAATTK
ncbi:MAG: ComEA family DNA-binding protein [Burkholderiales bacterium]